jgi:hypothetical protein
MRVVAADAIQYDTFSRPELYPFAMCTTEPIAFLAEVTLTAELITVVEINAFTFFVFQDIPVIFRMAVNTDKRTGAAVVETDAAMGKFSAFFHGDRFVAMASTAGVALHFHFSLHNLESSTLIAFVSHNRFLQYGCGLNRAVVIEGICLFD